MYVCVCVYICGRNFAHASGHIYNYSSNPWDRKADTFIVKLWSASAEMISSGTMKDKGLNDCRDLNSNLTPLYSLNKAVTDWL